MSARPIRATVHICIEPVPIPQYAKIQGAAAKDPVTNMLSPLAQCVAWDQLGLETIDAVWQQFRADLFRAAGKEFVPGETYP